MKVLLVLILSWFNLPNVQDHNEFFKYVSRNLKIPASISAKCEWQFAVVKVHTDKNNKIVSYGLLNRQSDGLKNSLGFLLGHKIFNKPGGNDKDYVFCISIENYKSDCLTERRQLLPPEVLASVFPIYSDQYKVNPNTVFIYDILYIGDAFDGIKD